MYMAEKVNIGIHPVSYQPLCNLGRPDSLDHPNDVMVPCDERQSQ